MDDSSAEAAREGFRRRLRTRPQAPRQTRTHDPRRERARCEELENVRNLGHAALYQAPTAHGATRPIENTNGLLRRPLPKGTDLSRRSQQFLVNVAEKKSFDTLSQSACPNHISQAAPG